MKKPIAAMIVAKMKGSQKGMSSDESSSSEDDSMEEEGGEGMLVASEEVMDAISNSDPKALMVALKSFIEQC